METWSRTSSRRTPGSRVGGAAAGRYPLLLASVALLVCAASATAASPAARIDELLDAAETARSQRDCTRAIALSDCAIRESERQGAFFFEALGYGAKVSALLACGKSKAVRDLEQDLVQRLDQTVKSGFTSATVRLSLCLALVQGAKSDQDKSSVASAEQSLKDAVARASGTEYASARAGAYYALAGLASASDDFLLAEHHLRKSIQEADACEEHYIAGLARISLSNILLHTAPEEAARNLLAASALFDSCGAVGKQITVRGYVVQLYRLLKDTTQALAAAVRYREIVEASGRSEILPDVWRTMAQVHIDAGSYGEADRYLRLELGLRRAGLDKEQLARCLEDLCVVHDKLGNSRLAIGYGQEAIRLFESTGHVSRSVMVANFIWPSLDAEHDTAGLRTTISYIEQRLDSIDGLDDLHRVLQDLADYYSVCSKPRDLDRAAALLLKGFHLSDSISERRVTYLRKLATASFLGYKHAERAVYLKEACRVAKGIGSSQLGSIYTDLSSAVRNADDDTSQQRVYAESAQAWFIARDDTSGLKQTLEALASVGWPEPTAREYGYANELLQISLASGDYSHAFAAYSDASMFLHNSAQNLAAFRIDSAWWALAVREQRGQQISAAGLSCLRSGRSSGRMTPELDRLVLASIEEVLSDSTQADRIVELAEYYRTDVGDTLKARQLYEKAIAVWDGKSLSDPFHGYAELLLAEGRTHEGIASLGRSIDISLRCGQLELAALQYQRVANLYNGLRDYRTAVLFGEKALAIYEQTAGRVGDSAAAENKASVLNDLVTFYLNLGETEKASEVAAQATAHAATGRFCDSNARVVQTLALLRSGRYDAGVAIAEQVIESCREPYVRALLAIMLYEVAWARSDTASMNQWRQTIVANGIPDSIVRLDPPLMLCMKAMQAYFRSDLAASAKYLVAARAAVCQRTPTDWDALATVYKFCSLCYVYAGDWQRALDACDSAFYCYDRNYTSLGDIAAVRGYTAAASAQLPLLSLVVARVYEKNHDLSIVQRFVDITEKISARSFLAAMADKAGGVPYSPTVEASILSARMAAITSELAGDLREDTKLALLKERDRVYSELTAFDRRLAGNDTGPYAAAAVVPVDVQTVMQDDLRADQIAIRFYLFPRSLFAFAFTRDSIWVYPLPPEETLAVRIKTLRSYYRAYRPGDVGAEAHVLRTHAHVLYQQLLGPLAGRIAGKELLVIPDRVLYYLPFEMLVSDTLRTPGRPDGIEYLCESTRVTYAPSLSVYYHLTNRKPAGGSVALALGKGSFSRQAARRNDSLIAARGITDLSYGIADLRCAEGEATDVYNVFSGASRAQGAKSRLMLGADASETNLKAAALDGYNYIHFATHGLVDDDNPDYSALLLDEVTSNSASEDGVLHAFEIAKLKLNTDLVVLSACNTGLGRLWSGDGMIGLNWAFLAAGARALCVTLWSIDDKSTSVFMRHFYQLLLKGESPAEALQRTRVFMLRETEYRSPYYWAPFVLIGAS